MKTPSSLPLLLLFAALPAAASELKAPARCDTEFLNKVANDFKAGGIVVDADRIVNKTANGLTIPALKLSEAKTCDAGTWRHLASGTPIAWRNAELGKHWDATNAGANAGVVLVADDFFKVFDAKAKAVLDAADAVIAAAAQLGLVTTADTAKTFGELLPEASGGQFRALKPKTVTAVAAAAQTTALPPEQFGPTLRKVIDETGAASAGGSAVKDFRLAVLALNQELGDRGVSRAEVVKRLGAGAHATIKDFTPGLPASYVRPKTEEFAVDAKFKAALEALIGAGAVPALDDKTARNGALLDSADLAVRNLVAIRASQVEQIVALAKEKLKGKTITQLEATLRAAGTVKSAPNALAAAVFSTLAQTPEYARLDSLYENNSQKPGWTDTQEAKDIFAAREAMKNAALSAEVVADPASGRKAVVYTPQGGKRIALGSLVPSSVENDPAARERAAAVISRFIVEGSLADAKTKAVVAAVAGEAPVGQPLQTGLTSAEGRLAAEVPLPPASKKIKEGAAGCDSPRDLARNDYETYAARQRAAASQMAGANVRSRNDVESVRLGALTAAAAECKKRKDAAAGIKQDHFDDAAIAQGERAKAAADAEAACAADVAAIETAAKDKIAALATLEAGANNPAALTAKADADLAAGFAVAIAASVETLRKDYTTAGNARLRKLADLTGNSSRLTTYTALWFARDWPLDASKKTELEAAVAACAKALGLGGEKISYRNPDNPDSVDKHCKVNENLTKFIVDSKGTNRPVPAAPEVK